MHPCISMNELNWCTNFNHEPFKQCMYEYVSSSSLSFNQLFYDCLEVLRCCSVSVRVCLGAAIVVSSWSRRCCSILSCWAELSVNVYSTALLCLAYTYWTCTLLVTRWMLRKFLGSESPNIYLGSGCWLLLHVSACIELHSAQNQNLWFDQCPVLPTIWWHWRDVKLNQQVKWSFSVLITLHWDIWAQQKACVHRFSQVALEKDTYHEVLLGILCWGSRSRPSMLATHSQKKSLVLFIVYLNNLSHSLVGRG